MIRPSAILSLSLIGTILFAEQPARAQTPPAHFTRIHTVTGPLSRAQPATPPFSTIDVRLSGSRETGLNSNLELWSPGYACSLLLSTPFYAGRLQTGVRVQPFESSSSARPDFWSGFLFLGWARRWALSQWLHAEIAARAGNFFMAFDEDDVHGIRNESELATAAAASVHIRPSDRFGIFIEGSYTRVYTFVRMNFTHVSAGITYRFDTPEWLGAVLQ